MEEKREVEKPVTRTFGTESGDEKIYREKSVSNLQKTMDVVDKTKDPINVAKVMIRGKKPVFCIFFSF